MGYVWVSDAVAFSANAAACKVVVDRLLYEYGVGVTFSAGPVASHSVTIHDHHNRVGDESPIKLVPNGLADGGVMQLISSTTTQHQKSGLAAAGNYNITVLGLMHQRCILHRGQFVVHKHYS